MKISFPKNQITFENMWRADVGINKVLFTYRFLDIRSLCSFCHSLNRQQKSTQPPRNLVKQLHNCCNFRVYLYCDYYNALIQSLLLCAWIKKKRKVLVCIGTLLAHQVGGVYTPFKHYISRSTYQMPCSDKAEPAAYTSTSTYGWWKHSRVVLMQSISVALNGWMKSVNLLNMFNSKLCIKQRVIAGNFFSLAHLSCQQLMTQ